MIHGVGESAMARKVLLIALAASCWAAVGGALLYRIQREKAFRAWYRAVAAELDVLERQRPRSLSSAEWAFMIHWTRNAHGNCCGMRSSLLVGQAQCDAFLQELRRKNSAGEVGAC